MLNPHGTSVSRSTVNVYGSILSGLRGPLRPEFSGKLRKTRVTGGFFETTGVVEITSFCAFRRNAPPKDNHLHIAAVQFP